MNNKLIICGNDFRRNIFYNEFNVNQLIIHRFKLKSAAGGKILLLKFTFSELFLSEINHRKSLRK